MMTPKQLAQRVHELRSRRALTQERLAEASGVSCETIRRVERGALFPSLVTITKLADSFGLTLGGFFADRLTPADDIAELARDLPELEQRVAFAVLRSLSDHAAGR
jgi:transcriptional regulator with XRE-family HTH domain